MINKYDFIIFNNKKYLVCDVNKSDISLMEWGEETNEKMP